MAVRIYMTNKQYVELQDEYDPESVWERIKREETFESRRFGEKVVVNKENVTSVQEVRSFR